MIALGKPLLQLLAALLECAFNFSASFVENEMHRCPLFGWLIERNAKLLEELIKLHFASIPIADQCGKSSWEQRQNQKASQIE